MVKSTSKSFHVVDWSGEVYCKIMALALAPDPATRCADIFGSLVVHVTLKNNKNMFLLCVLRLSKQPGRMWFARQLLHFFYIRIYNFTKTLASISSNHSTSEKERKKKTDPPNLFAALNPELWYFGIRNRSQFIQSIFANPSECVVGDKMD